MDHYARMAGIGAVAAALCAGCTSTGTGTGELTAGTGPAQSVALRWTSTDGGISGTMSASVAGQTYQGRFFQITQRTTAEALEPLWVHWRPGWYDWGYWGPMDSYPTTMFITRYTGKVVASLDAGADHLRCRFHLVDPPRGMAGGGEGECQGAAGQMLRASFAAA